eukprot:CAMPEP_0194265900 /NCGR_PEP_ID=MMETSP0169-20130528/986_1 /TAXON_ID=218684 /ORGANISM="Corethron pennatum, Strain L29A3" /LENGTH=254 /DNA_ID=CAMNT_0039006467 /DNA_START=41 /DNA_END=808 /DNA_ORIENTATION=+
MENDDDKYLSALLATSGALDSVVKSLNPYLEILRRRAGSGQSGTRSEDAELAEARCLVGLTIGTIRFALAGKVCRGGAGGEAVSSRERAELNQYRKHLVTLRDMRKNNAVSEPTELTAQIESKCESQAAVPHAALDADADGGPTQNSNKRQGDADLDKGGADVDEGDGSISLLPERVVPEAEWRENRAKLRKVIDREAGRRMVVAGLGVGGRAEAAELLSPDSGGDVDSPGPGARKGSRGSSSKKKRRRNSKSR